MSAIESSITLIWEYFLINATSIVVDSVDASVSVIFQEIDYVNSESFDAYDDTNGNRLAICTGCCSYGCSR